MSVYCIVLFSDVFFNRLNNFSVCAACKKPIEGRAVSAIDKKWHPEHFVCAHCEKPFAGERFYEHKGKEKQET